MEILIVGSILAVVVLGLVIRAIARAHRKKMLFEKYGDQDIVNRIMNKTVWQGETLEQLIDSLGRPADVDTKVMKTRHREIWKYGQDGRNRYRVRITVDDGIVVGWETR